MKLDKQFLLSAFVAIASLSTTVQAGTIYFDDFNDQQNINKAGVYTQSLAGSIPATSTTFAGGSPSAVWLAEVEIGGWGQRNYVGASDGVATPTSSNFLAFTPNADYIYTVQATIDTTGAAGIGASWFTLGFTSSEHNWNEIDSNTIDTAHAVRFNDATSRTITYTVSGAALVAAGVQYVGWITDLAGGVNLNGAQQVKIDNFSLTAVAAPKSSGSTQGMATK